LVVPGRAEREDAARALLERAEADADLLYAAVRTLVLAVFWAFFLATHERHHHGGVTVLALVGYTGLAAWTWIAVWRGWRGRVHALATVTADVLLTVATLAALARAAGLPADHLFALPPSGLVFLVVAHAALRFRAGVVLHAGILAAASLSVVAVLPLWQPLPASHDQPVPMAGHWPALPLGILLLTSVVLWFAARRTRGMLEVAIAEARHAGRLARFFSPAVAGRLAEEGVGTAERGGLYTVAVLFIDVRGFTAMAERMSPQELGPFLAEFRGHVTRSVFECDGTVDKFIGDGALVVFGAPEARPDAAACALGCAQSVLTAVDRWSTHRVASGLPPVRVAIGAHHGQVFAGIVGGEGMLEFTVLGDTVNVTERLQRAAADAGTDLVVSDAFRRACGDVFEDRWFTAMGALRLHGRADEIEAWAHVGQEPPAASVRQETVPTPDQVPALEICTRSPEPLQFVREEVINSTS
jgi:adenylate cyclase